MSDDLISRKALINSFDGVDPDGLLKISQFIDLIDDKPTAFDKEKVIEELERAGQECTECNDTGGAEAIEYAVEIVEKGGIE